MRILVAIAFLAVSIGIFSSSGFSSEWERIDSQNAKLQILNSDDKFSHQCSIKKWSAATSSRSWFCKDLQSSKYDFFIFYKHLDPGRGYSEHYNISRLLGRSKTFKNYGFGNEFIISTKDTKFEAYESLKPGAYCYGFKNQDTTSYGDNNLNGRWLVYGGFCIRGANSFEKSVLIEFINRVSISGLFDGQYTSVSRDSSQSLTSGDRARSTDDYQSTEQKLQKLKELYEKKLIPEDLYNRKVNAILE